MPTIAKQLQKHLEKAHKANKFSAVAEAAGVPRSTVYRAYQSPEKVSVAVADKLVDAVNAVTSKPSIVV